MANAAQARKYTLVSGGQVELKIGGNYEAIADGGKNAIGEPVTEVTNRRGYVYRILGKRDDVSRELGFGGAA